VLRSAPHGYQGYPFCVEIDAEYRLEADTGLHVAITARNRGAGAAPYGTGSHPYLTVLAPSVDDCQLTMPAARWLPMDDRGIPSGPVAPVEGTAYDFRQPRVIGDTQLDHALTGLERDAEGRAWARLAADGEPGLAVDDCEIRRAGPSYTYDTLAGLRASLGPKTPLLLLLGDDAANQLHTWHRWRELFDLAHLVLVERPYEPPAPAPELAAFLRGRRAANAQALLDRPAGSWLPVSIPPLAISSTRVRQLLKAGRSVRGLVPDAVIQTFTTEDVRALTHDEDPAQD
jgi:nicotinate-nucleotide adenylyltransferase